MSLSIATLAPDALAVFLMRHRRGETLERFEPRLDHFLREILEKANEFVPSEAGAILLDDPQAKMMAHPKNQLTFIASLGGQASRMLGIRTSGCRGVAGAVYTTGRPTRCTTEGDDKEFYTELDVQLGIHTRSLLGVPVVLGNSVCGVLLLINRLGRDAYTEEESKLLEIFAGYISSSIQNTLDGIRAKELARRDDLTGLFNDRYFHFRLREEILQADDSEANLSLIFIDLDRFKQINDRFGHLEGSRTLHELGILLQREAPSDAVLARYGGDEFVVILPSYGTSRAEKLARALQRKISTSPMLSERLDMPGLEKVVITASMGVANLQEHVPTRGDVAQRANILIRMADAAMYRAKAEGRNRVVVAVPKTKEYPIVTTPR